MWELLSRSSYFWEENYWEKVKEIFSLLLEHLNATWLCLFYDDWDVKRHFWQIKEQCHHIYTSFLCVFPVSTFFAVILFVFLGLQIWISTTYIPEVDERTLHGALLCVSGCDLVHQCLAGNKKEETKLKFLSRCHCLIFWCSLHF